MNKKIKRRLITSSNQLLFSEKVHPLMQRIYAHRGLVEDHQVNTDLPKMLSPDGLKGMVEAVEILSAVIAKQQKIVIVGDFDADGATSTTLAVLALSAMGAADVEYLVPNRFEFGYGLSPEIVVVASQMNPQLIVTVDNGISSVEGVAKAKSLGIDVIITDHHLPGEQIPAADAIVNPNQAGCEFESKSLAGVGVIFYVMVALRASLDKHQWFEKQGIRKPNLASFLDLVALGTVADVVPLDQNNRILVQQGLKRIRAGQCRPGIRALLEVAGKDINSIVSSDMGFIVGPRLNAAGRLDDMSHGIEALLTTSEQLAKDYALELDGMNKDRRSIEHSMQQQAIEQLDALDLENIDYFGLSLFENDWHQGVVGILASRVKDKLHRPVIAFAPAKLDLGEDIDDDDEIKGSGRSIQGFHLRDALDAVATRHPGLINKFGGHAMAAGLTIRRSQFEQFREAFDEEVKRHLKEDDLKGVVWSDGELTADEINMPVANLIRSGGPWGQAFPEPVFDGLFQLVKQRIVGEKHLKLVLGLPNSNQIVDAIAFNVDTDVWPNQSAQQVRVAYQLDINEYRGRRSVQLLVQHLELC
ncbi:MAG: single-stranded-DNA-specific exonuclease RecJ [Moraxellaceae bacterium]|nr:MAG: single-stranded-DNA-specific exonuclease RecJ [Moraxellaceae bacterium]